MDNPERFDPTGAVGTLIDSEHRARYLFAAQGVAGKEVLDASCGTGYGIEILSQAGASAVTGVDISAEAIAAAREHFGEYAAALAEADLRELPFEDDSFDFVVSFETIEHVEEPEKALAELHRVLRPDGVLVVSSPNPDAYVGNNEHHVHEFRLAELRETVGGLLKNLAAFRQDAWLGSAVRPFDEDGAMPEIRRTASDGSDPPYSIIVASDAALSEFHGVITIGDAFDVRWWSEQVENHRKQIVEVHTREVKAGQLLQETSAALLEANRGLAQVPVLEYRLQELEERHKDLADSYHDVLASTSWKITAPLRRRRAS